MAVAQNDEQVIISPDRPGMGTGPGVMPHKYFQIESGFIYEQSNTGNVRTDVFSYNQLLFRYGLLPFAELRLSGDFTETRTDIGGVKSSLLGMGPINIGTKIHFYQGTKYIPETGILLNAAIPGTGLEEYRVEHIAPSVYMLFQNNLTENFSLAYNLGAEWDGTNNQPAWFYALGLGYGISDKLSTYIEHYGSLSDGANAFYLNTGLAYLLTPKWQIDAYAAMDMKGIDQLLQLNLGIAWLIP